MTCSRPFHRAFARVMRTLLLAGAAASFMSAKAQAETPAGVASPTPPAGTVWTRRTTTVLPDHLLSSTRPLVIVDGDGHMAIDLVGAGRVAKGAPYCADTVRESVQTLSDGNRILQSISGRLCRDSEGRTRQEEERDGRRQVWLHDPSTQEAWALDPSRKTARLFALKPTPLQLPLAVLSSASSPGGARPVTIVKEVVRRRDAQGRETEQVELRAVQVDPRGVVLDGPTLRAPTITLSASGPKGSSFQASGGVRMSFPPPVVPLPGPVSLTSLNLAPRGPGVETALASREIEGLNASGVRTTWTIEAGKVGNEKPIVITREVWTSPELRLTVLSRDHDPRSGETSYRLTNLKRGEPDATLMRVPADYEVQRNPVMLRTPAPPVPPVPPTAPPLPPKG